VPFLSPRALAAWVATVEPTPELQLFAADLVESEPAGLEPRHEAAAMLRDIAETAPTARSRRRGRCRGELQAGGSCQAGQDQAPVARREAAWAGKPSSCRWSPVFLLGGDRRCCTYTRTISKAQATNLLKNQGPIWARPIGPGSFCASTVSLSRCNPHRP